MHQLELDTKVKLKWQFKYGLPCTTHICDCFSNTFLYHSSPAWHWGTLHGEQRWWCCRNMTLPWQSIETQRVIDIMNSCFVLACHWLFYLIVRSTACVSGETHRCRISPPLIFPLMLRPESTPSHPTSLSQRPNPLVSSLPFISAGAYGF